MIGRIPIIDISPVIYFGGECVPVKATPGERVVIAATIIREGHELLSARAILFDGGGQEIAHVPMLEKWPGSDRYEGVLTPNAMGEFSFSIVASAPNSELRSESAKYPIRADRVRAAFSAWYEFFPRSEGATLTAPGTFTTAQARLAGVAAMGFDVLYLPPIHPIGISHRKGANNSLTPTAGEPGVPWAIGNSAGGHDAINPELGTIADFEIFVAKANSLGIEIAMDLALQTSPDHPWVASNPEWFTHRADGSIAYAENPPKKYEDIYPINFDKDYEGFLKEVLRVIRFWRSKGVTLFRVDNPHTKPVHFWQDLLAQVHQESPEIIFLAEAFTRPAMMHALGKVGFHQSYTYFTWRTTKEEITSYGRELAYETSAFMRPNLWVNTPDILPKHLQSGARAIFALLAILAATLAPAWGMYAGYELMEHQALSDGGEEYLDSEKYQIRIRDWAGAELKGESLAPFIATLNQIRNAHPALQRLNNLIFHHTNSDAIIAYSKMANSKAEGSDLILVVLNLDPTNAQEATVSWDMQALGLRQNNFIAQDLLTGGELAWSDQSFIRLDPNGEQGNPGAVAHIGFLSVNQSE